MTHHDFKRMPKTNSFYHYHTFETIISDVCLMTGLQHEVGANNRYKHTTLRQSSHVTGNMSYNTAKICKSTIMIDLRCSFIGTKSIA